MQWTWVLEAREAKQQNHSQCAPTALAQQQPKTQFPDMEAIAALEAALGAWFRE